MRLRIYLICKKLKDSDSYIVNEAVVKMACSSCTCIYPSWSLSIMSVLGNIGEVLYSFLQDYRTMRMRPMFSEN